MTSFSFAGERVLITGASQGIGLAVAEAFARAGAELAILAENARIHEAKAALESMSGRPVQAFQCDITDRAAVRAALSALSRIDVLVNNAAIQNLTPMDEPGEAIEALFRRVIEINVLGTYYVTREALPKMTDGGRILFTASVWSKSAAMGYSAYVASKHAILGFMRVLAKELGRSRGIRVNAVCPGWVRTEGAMGPLAVDSRWRHKSVEDILDEVFRAQALDGLMEPEDIASAYLYLASPEAKNITGQTLHVDRGEVMD